MQPFLNCFGQHILKFNIASERVGRWKSVPLAMIILGFDGLSRNIITFTKEVFICCLALLYDIYSEQFLMADPWSHFQDGLQCWGYQTLSPEKRSSLTSVRWRSWPCQSVRRFSLVEINQSVLSTLTRLMEGLANPCPGLCTRGMSSRWELCTLPKQLSR